ncbi:MAG: helix-turn-helix domain-containing protein [Candidatus Thorarchaeota archaeon]
MKEEILRLREEGKSYNQICEIVGCSKSTVSYHCGEGQKEKSKIRSKKNNVGNVICKKIGHFVRRSLQSKSDDFQRERGYVYKPNKKGYRRYQSIGKHLPKSFNYKDVIERFGENTKCYLTGRDINLLEPKQYQFDHKVPPNKGGGHTIDNLGIVCKEANFAKGNLLVEEFLDLCKEVLENHGYKTFRGEPNAG